MSLSNEKINELSQTMYYVSQNTYNHLSTFAEILQSGIYKKTKMGWSYEYQPSFWRKWLLGEKPETRYCFWGLYMTLFLPDKPCTWSTLVEYKEIGDLITLFLGLNDDTDYEFPEIGKILANKLLTTIQVTHKENSDNANVTHPNPSNE